LHAENGNRGGVDDYAFVRRQTVVDNRADYRYSSACFYDRAEPPVVEVDDARVWLV
jgi:hypothetical protein